jgi:hypothetical protein
MGDKENQPVNLWYSQDIDPKAEAKKHVVFRLAEGEDAKATRNEDRKVNRSDDEHSTNVTPGSNTSEFLMEKMKELRERLEKLKSKNRKSDGDGIIEGAVADDSIDPGTISPFCSSFARSYLALSRIEPFSVFISKRQFERWL